MIASLLLLHHPATLKSEEWDNTSSMLAHYVLFAIEPLRQPTVHTK